MSINRLKKTYASKTAIVTGGASGIGCALCEELSLLGSKVIIADINLEMAQCVAAAVKDSGGHAQAAFLDVSHPGEVQTLVDSVADNYGSLDYMFNNAGVAVVGELADMQPEHWRSLIDVNLWGVIYGTQAAYSVMIRQRSGHIINTASMAGLLPSPTGSGYAMTKHAVVGLSTSLRVEAAAFGVKVSTVCPGAIQTGIFDRATLLKGEKNDVFPRKTLTNAMKAESCARSILRGVAHNKPIITVPFWSTHLLWWLYRFFPFGIYHLAALRLGTYRNRLPNTRAKVS